MKRPLLSKSSLMAIGVAVAAAVWMLSGFVGAKSPTTDDSADEPAISASSAVAADSISAPLRTQGKRAPDAAGIRVSVRKSRAEPVVRDVVVSGRTEPNRTVELKAETEGRVVELGAERGRPVAAGEPVARLDERERQARLEQAEAMVAQRELQYKAAKDLETRQLASQVQIAEAYANLVTARAELEQIRLDLERTEITAPFDGVLEDRSVEIGDYVGIGDPVARVADNDPLIAVGELSEREIGALSVGGKGRVQLVSGSVAEGTVRYISPVADESTRTFRIELAIANPDNALPAGMTAELRLPAAEIEAHFLSPALLTLDDDGDIGVKVVDENHKVRFHEVQIVRSANDGIWVTGLPDEALVITVGQGFVAMGETVQPVHE